MEVSALHMALGMGTPRTSHFPLIRRRLQPFGRLLHPFGRFLGFRVCRVRVWYLKLFQLVQQLVLKHKEN